MEDFDLRQVKTKKGPETGVDGDRNIRNTAKVAAVSSLRNEITRAFAEAGKIVEKVDPANTTLECPFCGGRIRAVLGPTSRSFAANAKPSMTRTGAAPKHFEEVVRGASAPGERT